MLTIILGIIFAISTLVIPAFLISIRTNTKFTKTLEELCESIFLIVPAIITSISLVIGIFFSSGNYTNWKLQNEIELVSLSNDVKYIYVTRTNENVYSYRHKIDSEFGTSTSTNYRTDTVTGNVEEIEDPNCKIPVLKIYKRTSKRSIWRFGTYDEEKYIFYVPEGTINKELNLN